MPRRIPYAVADYEEIIRDDYHFVDKTRFIRELENYKIPVFLRPRRFGKSLWCSILECYYDVNRAERFEELFGITDIGLEPTRQQNSYLILRFDFSIVKLEDQIEDLEKRFNEVCALSFENFVSQYGKITGFEGPIDPFQAATTTLGQILQKVKASGAPPLFIIVDEYDNFTNQLLTTGQDQFYHHLTTGDSFLRTFYKALKAGVGEASIAKVFITGVLPITMDDLTSGFNIGQIITLKENTLAMMGFTQQELDDYVDRIFLDNNWGTSLRKKVAEGLKIHYNGYRFLPESESLYNSTICNHYLNHLVIDKGKIPRERIDQNLKVDINWLRRLGRETTGELVDQLLTEGSLPTDMTLFQSQFNREKFVQSEFFPMSLFFLGLLSFEDEFSLRFPNLTVKTLFIEYFNELMNIKVSSGYTDMCRTFLKDQNWENLYAGYWKRYVGQIPAQAFDKANENFFRTTFYEICQRYLGGHLSLAIEVNRSKGRSDFEAHGKPGSRFDGQAWVAEFKHFSKDQAKRNGVDQWTQARETDVQQVKKYAEGLAIDYPELKVQGLVIYTLSSGGFKCFENVL
jgi:hypothetical protein